jgi:hypothetical protein
MSDFRVRSEIEWLDEYMVGKLDLLAMGHPHISNKAERKEIEKELMDICQRIDDFTSRLLTAIENHKIVIG